MSNSSDVPRDYPNIFPVLPSDLNLSNALDAALEVLCNRTDDVVCNGTPYTLTDRTQPPGKAHLISGNVVAALFSIIMIIGLVGNGLVVSVVIWNRQMRSVNNVLILNLAIADLLFLVFCVPFRAWNYAVSDWPFGDAWCRIVRYLEIVTLYASIYTLVFMSVDRYLAVVHPVASLSLRTLRHAVFVIIASWNVSIVVCIPVIVVYSQQVYKKSVVCFFRIEDGYDYNAFLLAVSFTSYVIPLGLILCLYVLMLKSLWLGSAPGGRPTTSELALESRRRVTRLVVIVVLVFALCWGPTQVLRVMKGFNPGRSSKGMKIFKVVAHTMAYLNSCVNPILYAFLSVNFRKAFRRVMACGKVGTWESQSVERDSSSVPCTTTMQDIVK